MSVFGRYADWYDLFYADKDYRAEAAYVDGVLRRHGAAEGSLLEIGCGTGAHAQWLVSDGWQVCGIDRSEDMLAQARARFDDASSVIELHRGDARNFDLGRDFDAVVSLFHVMSYQAETGDIESALRSVRRHLRPNGLFLFDFWFGPAVLAQRPESRTRTVENTRYRVVRIATPTLHDTQRIVDVRYDFEITDKYHGDQSELDELHRMRYLFPDEIERMAKTTGFRLDGLTEWMSERAPSEQSWNACAILRASDGPD